MKIRNIFKKKQENSGSPVVIIDSSSYQSPSPESSTSPFQDDSDTLASFSARSSGSDSATSSSSTAATVTSVDHQKASLSSPPHVVSHRPSSSVCYAQVQHHLPATSLPSTLPSASTPSSLPPLQMPPIPPSTHHGTPISTTPSARPLSLQPQQLPRQSSSSASSSSASSSVSSNSAHSSQFSAPTSFASTNPPSPFKTSQQTNASVITTSGHNDHPLPQSSNPFSNSYEIPLQQPQPTFPIVPSLLPINIHDPPKQQQQQQPQSQTNSNSKSFLAFPKSQYLRNSRAGRHSLETDRPASATTSNSASANTLNSIPANTTHSVASVPHRTTSPPNTSSNRTSKYFFKSKKTDVLSSAHYNTSSNQPQQQQNQQHSQATFSSISAHIKKRASTFGPDLISRAQGVTSGVTRTTASSSSVSAAPAPAAAAGFNTLSSFSATSSTFSPSAGSAGASSLLSTSIDKSDKSDPTSDSWPPLRPWVPVNETLYNDYAASRLSHHPLTPNGDEEGTIIHKLQGFSVMSYNILSSLYTNRLENTIARKVGTSSSFSSSPSSLASQQAMRSRRERMALIMKEIKYYTPDILCLQEVDAQEYYGQMHYDLADYDSIYAPKHSHYTSGGNRPHSMLLSSSSSPSHSSGGGPGLGSTSIQPLVGSAAKNSLPIEGPAIFYKMDRFRLLEKRIFNYADLTLYYKSASAASKPETETLVDEAGLEAFAAERDVRERVAGRSNVGIVAVLRHVPSGQIIIVANTQLVPDAKMPPTKLGSTIASTTSNSLADVRMVQAALCLEQIEYFTLKYTSAAPRSSDDNGNKVPVVLCGDLNSAATSGVYDLLAARGGPVSKLNDWQGRSYARFTDGLHPWHTGERLGLRSSYLVWGEDELVKKKKKKNPIVVATPPPPSPLLATEIHLMSNNPFSSYVTPSPTPPPVLPLSAPIEVVEKEEEDNSPTTTIHPKRRHILPYTKMSTAAGEGTLSDYIWYSTSTLAVAEVLGPDPNQRKRLIEEGEDNTDEYVWNDKRVNSTTAGSGSNGNNGNNYTNKTETVKGKGHETKHIQQERLAQGPTTYPSDHVCLLTRFEFKNQQF